MALGFILVLGFLADRAVRREARAQEDLRRLVADLELARNAAERASQTKSRFLATISHDLHQSLRACQSFLDHAAQGRVPFHEALPKITASAGMLGEMLDSVVRFAQLDAGHELPQVTEFLAEEVLDPIRQIMTPVAAAKGLTLRVPACHAVIRSDPVLLKRVLLNLVTNAIRNTRHGKVLVGGRRAGRTLRLHVIDSGPGMAADQMARLKQRLDGSRVRAPPHPDGMGLGLGLGLGVVRDISELLGHRIHVSSRPGTGTGFAVGVPMPIAHAGRIAADVA